MPWPPIWSLSGTRAELGDLARRPNDTTAIVWTSPWKQKTSKNNEAGPGLPFQHVKMLRKARTNKNNMEQPSVVATATPATPADQFQPEDHRHPQCQQPGLLRPTAPAPAASAAGCSSSVWLQSSPLVQRPTNQLCHGVRLFSKAALRFQHFPTLGRSNHCGAHSAGFGYFITAQRVQTTCLNQLAVGVGQPHCTWMVIHWFGWRPSDACEQMLRMLGRDTHPFEWNDFRLGCIRLVSELWVVGEKDTLASHHARTVDPDISLHAYMW